MQEEFLTIGIVISKLCFLFIIKFYLNVFLEKKKISVVTVLPWILQFIWQYWLIAGQALPPLINMIISVASLYSLAMFSYLGKPLKKIVFTLLFCSISNVIELFGGYIFSLFNIDFMSKLPLFFHSICVAFLLYLITLGLKKSAKMMMSNIK